MLSKNKIKYINSLKRKKVRENENLFLAEGNKLVHEIINSNFLIKNIIATKSWLEENKNLNIEEIITATESELKKISSLTNPQNVIAVVEKPSFSWSEKKIFKSLSLVLDDLQDTGNLGTIIRIADWFGIEHIFCSKNTVDVFNPKVIQATMGSITRVKVFYLDLPVFFKKITKEKKDFNIYGTFLEGKNIYKNKLSDKGFIIMGNEGKGINDNLLEFINQKITIPSFSLNEVESLNVSVATAIICAEFKSSKIKNIA